MKAASQPAAQPAAQLLLAGLAEPHHTKHHSSLKTAYAATTHTMLPKNYSLRKILVVFSFFEIFCTRVGNSERFSQGEYSFQVI